MGGGRLGREPILLMAFAAAAALRTHGMTKESEYRTSRSSAVGIAISVWYDEHQKLYRVISQD